MVFRPFDWRLGRFEDTIGGGGDLRANAVTRNENNLMRCHFVLRTQE